MSDRGYTAQDAIGAIRLVLEAGADRGVRVRVIREILASVPEPKPGDTRPVHLLIDAVQAANAEFCVTDHERRIRKAQS